MFCFAQRIFQKHQQKGLFSISRRKGGLLAYSYVFDIPFSRQQLADYLAVERSGLSVELCKMRDEGLLEFQKSHFVLKV